MSSDSSNNNINVPQNTNFKTKSPIKSYLNSLNNTQFEADTKWIKVSDLTIGEKYKIKSAKKIKTKFGESVMVFIKGEDGLTYGLFLPKRFSKLTVKQVNQLERFNITYNGSNDRNYDNTDLTEEEKNTLKFKNADNINFSSCSESEDSE